MSSKKEQPFKESGVMGRKRQELRNEETRNLILYTAKEIIEQEGIRGLSIRKIGNRLSYAPSFIYHYFKSKEEIVKLIIEEIIYRIVACVDAVEKNNSDPEEVIKELARSFIYAAFEFPSEFKAYIFERDMLDIEVDNLLIEGSRVSSTAIAKLCEIIDMGITQGYFKECNIELTAQIIWTSIIGLATCVVIEKKALSEQCRTSNQIDRLLQQQLAMILYGIRA